MASEIKAGNSTSGVGISSDNTGILVLKTGTGAGTTAVTVGTDQAVTLAGNLSVTGFATVTTSVNAPNTFGFKNRIINGGMVIDQRNAGASVTITSTADNTYTLDRWAVYGSQASKFSVQQSSTAPTGYSSSLLVTSLSAYSITSTDRFYVTQFIEGFNTADLIFGSASAATVTLSFWVRSSLTGTFGGTLMNSASNRNYPFTYTISAANTWEQKTVTIAGDTTGTWIGATNGIGIKVFFGLGVGSTASGTAGAWGAGNYNSATGATSVVGTNGATFYITGVQLEKGSTATSFDFRSYGTELQLAQRYYYQLIGTQAVYYDGYGGTGSYPVWNGAFPVVMRATPTVTIVGTYQYANCSGANVNTTFNSLVNISATGSGTVGRMYFNSPAGGGYTATAEL